MLMKLLKLKFATSGVGFVVLGLAFVAIECLVLWVALVGRDVQGEVAIDAEANAQSPTSPPSYAKAVEEV